MKNRKPKIISLGFAVPEHSYTQEQIFDLLGYPKHFWRLFARSGIEKRHFWLPPERIKKLTWQEACEEYQKGAIELSKQAIINCLDGRDLKNVCLLSFASCTGISPGPTIGHYLIQELGFKRDTYITNILGQGCEGAFPSLRRAYDFTRVTSKPSLAIACELCSLTYFPEPSGKPDRENDYELLRGNALFGDGCSCALIAYGDDWRHPEIIDFEVYTNPNYIDDLGFMWRDGRLRLRLSKRVPDIAPELAKEAVDRILNRNDIRAENVNHFIVHAAGMKVLDNIRDSLGLPEEKLQLSRKVLSAFGNLSSATVGVIGKHLITEGNPQLGDHAIMVTIGPGMSSGATILRFS